jgi:Ca2+/H+ antiporter
LIVKNVEAASRASPLREWPLALAVVVLSAALLGQAWIAGALGQPVMLIAVLAVLCGVILAAAVAIVRHADVLANRLGEPAGTLLLTLAITGLEVAMVAFVMTVLVLTPESIAAVQAALENRLQRSVNVLLGSVLASIGLTIPLVIVVSLATGRRLVLGLDAAEMVMLVLTLVTATLTFSLPRTNVLLGCVHLLLFGVYFMLIFDQ